MRKGEAKEIVDNIKEECDRHDNCLDCPFFNTNIRNCHFDSFGIPKWWDKLVNEKEGDEK